MGLCRSKCSVWTGTSIALVLQSRTGNRGSLAAFTMALDPSEDVSDFSDSDDEGIDLVPPASQTYSMLPPPEGSFTPSRTASLHCSWRAAAVCSADQRGVRDFQLCLDRPGRWLFNNKHPTACSWSACSESLAGIVKPHDDAISDGLTGDVLTLISGQSRWQNFAVQDRKVTSAAWAPSGLLQLNNNWPRVGVCCRETGAVCGTACAAL